MLERLAGCIDQGRKRVLETQKQVEAYAEAIRYVDATLDPASDSWAIRKRIYQTIGSGRLDEEDSIWQEMGRVMASFKKGLFVGGGRSDLPRDNLDLERWFRLPKGHERRIHGRSHAGVRIVQEGATLLLALDGMALSCAHNQFNLLALLCLRYFTLLPLLCKGVRVLRTLPESPVFLRFQLFQLT